MKKRSRSPKQGARTVSEQNLNAVGGGNWDWDYFFGSDMGDWSGKAGLQLPTTLNDAGGYDAGGGGGGFFGGFGSFTGDAFPLD